MNTVQNGKGDRARNNWGDTWYAGYNLINWHHAKPTTEIEQAEDLSAPADPKPAPLGKRSAKS